MSLRDKEKKIKEQRTIDAMKKDFMGIEGKLGVIVRNLGQPIITQNDSSCPDIGSTEFFEYSGRTLEDLVGGGEEDDVPTIEQYDQSGNPVAMPEGWEWGEKRKRNAVTTKTLGWHFDGLSRGFHFEIKYLGNELTATYKGYLVYAEVAGDLRAFSREKEWEGKVESLYKIAKKLDQTAYKIRKEETKKDNIDEKQGFLDKIKTLWGI